MNLDERIAAIEAARAAIAQAKSRCEAADVGRIAVIGQLTIAQALDDIEKGLGDGLASAARQQQPIKIGDSVEVVRLWHSSKSERWVLEKVGRVWIRAGGQTFYRDNGRERSPSRQSNYQIHHDDLARINRDFPRKAGAR